MMKISINKLYIPLGLISSLSVHAHTNFIIINIDDMGYGDLSSTGAINYETPNIDKMANTGMRFTHFYSAQPVSGASRAGLLTGCYPNRVGMWGAPNPSSDFGISDKETTIAEMLKERGYTSAIFGKWHLGHHHQFLPLQHGFDEYYGIPYSNDMWPNHPTVKFPPLPLIENNETIELNPNQSQFTTQFTERAIDFIHRNREKPFFLYLAHPMPHVPLFVSDKFKGKSKQGLYGDVMMELDWSVGKILKKLKEEGLEENTLVIVTSDNGPWLNYGNHAGSTAGFRQGKGTTFEGGLRVPCIMQWKGTITEGSICNQLSSAIDFLPTFAKIANAELPKKKIDGVDISSLILQAEGANPRKSFYFYYNKNDLEAVTDGNFKLVFPHTYRDYENSLPGNDGKPGETKSKTNEKLWLFDLRRDPGERHNVIELYPEEIEKLQKIAFEARMDLGDDLTGVEGRNVRAVGKVLRK